MFLGEIDIFLRFPMGFLWVSYGFPMSETSFTVRGSEKKRMAFDREIRHGFQVFTAHLRQMEIFAGDLRLFFFLFLPM